MDKTPVYRKKIIPVLRLYPQVNRAVLFGSRAKGTHREGSDIDLAQEGENLTPQNQASLEEALDDLLLTVPLDLIILSPDTKPELREHIRRCGIPWYEA